MPERIDAARSALGVGFVLALVPLFYTLGPALERRLFPVVTPARAVVDAVEAGGLVASLRYSRLRRCTFVGLRWFDATGRLDVRHVAPGTEDEQPLTLDVPTEGGPWRIGGRDDLVGTRAYARHRCHPFWVTTSDFYRG